MSFIATGLSLILLVPFFGWGVYTLRMRYVLHDEPTHLTEALTIAGLVAFYVFEFAILWPWVNTSQILLLFAGLGLFVAGAALYGPILVSVIAALVVNFFMPVDRQDRDKPQLGPAETLEHRGDYEGALQEYLVIARIFPKDPVVSSRVAGAMMKLGRSLEAVTWFERTIELAQSEEQSLSAVNRLVEIFHSMNRTEESKKVLERQAKRYPQGRRTDSVMRRISALDREKSNPSEIAL